MLIKAISTHLSCPIGLEDLHDTRAEALEIGHLALTTH